MRRAQVDRVPFGATADTASSSERAFLTLVDRHHASLTRVAQLWLDDPAAIEATVQQTWVRMLQRLEPFDQQSSLKGWLCVTLIRLARGRLAPEQDLPVEPSCSEMPAVDPGRFRSHEHRWQGHWQKPPQPWSLMDEQDIQHVIAAAIEALPRAQRIIVVLRDVEQLTSHEVQSALGSSEEDQRALLHLARSRIRAALEHFEVARRSQLTAADSERAS